MLFKFSNAIFIRGLQAAVALLFQYFLAKNYDVATVGEMNLIWAYFIGGSILFAFGYPKESIFSKQYDEQSYDVIKLSNLLSQGIIFLLVLVLTFLIGFRFKNYIVLVMVVPGSILYFFHENYRARGLKSKAILFWNLGVTIVGTICAFFSFSIINISMAVSLSAIMLIFVTIYSNNGLPLKLNINYRIWNLRERLSFAQIDGFEQLRRWLPFVLVENILDYHNLGLFSVITRISFVLSIIIASLNLIVLPELKKCDFDISKIKLVYHKLLRLIIIVATPLFILLFFNSNAILELFGSIYVSEGSTALRILLISAFIDVVSGPLGSIHYILLMSKRVLYANLISTVFLLISSFLFADTIIVFSMVYLVSVVLFNTFLYVSYRSLVRANNIGTNNTK